MQRKGWHPIPTKVLRSARLKREWSYETAARAVGISSKTWERYEKRGAVPLDIVSKVIDVFELKITVPPGATLHLVEIDLNNGDLPTTAEVLLIIRQAEDAVARLAAVLQALADRFPPAAPQADGEAEQRH